MGSELPARCLVLLMSSPHTGEKTHNQTPCTHTQEPLKECRHEQWEIIQKTHKFCACLHVNKHANEHTNKNTHGCKWHLLGPPRIWWPQLMTPNGKQPAFINKARWHTNTDSCMLTCFYCGRLLRPLSNENHMMDHIQQRKNNWESPPQKHQQTMLKKPRGFRGKAFRGFDPSSPLKRAEAIGWFQLFDIISDGPLVQNKALTIRDV